MPLTADDVEFTYKLMIDPKTPTAYSGDFLAIESFKKTGRLSFEVRYAKPFARSLMTWMGAILPKHVLEGQDIMTTPVARKPIGAGPYPACQVGRRFHAYPYGLGYVFRGPSQSG